MPTGAFVMHWDEREGAEIVGAYPPEITIGEKTMMQVYSQHQFEGKMGITTIQTSAVNLVSYFTGPDSQYYLILTLKEREEGDKYEDGLREIGPQMLKYEYPEQIKLNLPLLYQQIVLTPNFTEEQRVAAVLSDPMQYDIIVRLREEIAISKSEIEVWLADKHKVRNIDIESMFLRLLKLGLVKVASIKGIGSQLLFFVRDLITFRRPPGEMLKNPINFGLPGSLRFDYTKAVRTFFETYSILDDISIITVSRLLLDPLAYQIINRLRQKVLTMADLEPLKDNDFEDLDSVLASLEQAHVMVTLTDAGSKINYYALVNDFYYEIRYPEYNLDVIAELYRNKIQDKRILLKALSLMQEEFYTINKIVKKAKTSGKDKKTSVKQPAVQKLSVLPTKPA